MAARGRGRGRGRPAFAKDSIDFDSLPGPVTQPPPMFPPFEMPPRVLEVQQKDMYKLMAKQTFMEKLALETTRHELVISNEETKADYKELLKIESCTIDWRLFPKELHFKTDVKLTRKATDKKDINIESKFIKYEQKEEQVTNIKIKQEAADSDEDEEFVDEEQDEEMDEGTDYVNNYFDNGEDYEDEEDNLDDGPVY